MARMSRVAALIAAGFDRSTHVPFTRTWDVRCSCCEALVISGVACHERGCPNAPRDSDTREEWDDNLSDNGHAYC